MNERSFPTDGATAAIDAARKVRERAAVDPFERGLLVARYGVITRARNPAEIMRIEFADKSIADFDPDRELLDYHWQAA